MLAFTSLPKLKLKIQNVSGFCKINAHGEKQMLDRFAHKTGVASYHARKSPVPARVPALRLRAVARAARFRGTGRAQKRRAQEGAKFEASATE
jgi:hypothetical protein